MVYRKPRHRRPCFLTDCKALAQALSSPNLKDLFVSNFASVLRLEAKLKEAQDALDYAQAAQALHDAELETLQLMNNEKSQALARAEKTLDHYQQTTVPAAGSGSTPDRAIVKIPDPPTFSKGRAEYRSFKAKLQEKLLGDGHRFRGEGHRLAYAVGFLAEEADAIVRPLRESGELSTVADLLKYLDATYEDPDRKGTAERELRALKQGNTDFTSHNATFRSLVAVFESTPHLNGV